MSFPIPGVFFSQLLSGAGVVRSEKLASLRVSNQGEGTEA